MGITSLHPSYSCSFKLSRRFGEYMRTAKHKKTWRAILVYSKVKTSRATVRRHYAQWRQEQGIPQRCDNPVCRYHTEPLMWNNQALPLILDHKDGNSWDNRPEMLRYLCPNCNYQLPTSGGYNKGRLKMLNENGFLIIERDGRKSYTHFATGGFVLGGSALATFHQAISNADGEATPK